MVKKSRVNCATTGVNKLIKLIVAMLVIKLRIYNAYNIVYKNRKKKQKQEKTNDKKVTLCGVSFGAYVYDTAHGLMT